MKISIYKSITQPFDKNYINIDMAINRIKYSRYAEKITKLRTLKGKAYDKEKITLPVYRWSGVFEYGKDEGIIEHSGLICLDFDKYESSEIMNQERQRICDDKFTFICFTSPSGNGLKVIVRIPESIENHRAHFNALKSYYKSDYFDDSSINISRACFDSYDKDIYHNPDAQIFTEMKAEREELDYNIIPTIPVKSSNKIISNIQKWWDSKYQLVEGNRNNSIFQLCSAFNRYGIQQSECESYILSKFNDVLDRNELLKCVRSGYREREYFNTASFEDNEIINFAKNEIKSGQSPKIIKSKLKDYSKDEQEIIIESAQNELDNFWSKNDKGRVVISPHKYKEWLSQKGYFKYFNSELSYILIKIENNFVKEVNEDIIKDYVLEQMTDSDVFDHLAQNTKYFKRDFLNYMTPKDVSFIRDKHDKSYLFFKNTLIEISANKITKMGYYDFGQHVWEKQVIDRDYQSDETDCDFSQFIKNISKTEDRFLSFKSVIGYMLHSYKEPHFSPAIILNDEDISDNPQGGTGKGLLMESLSKFKNTCVINGKQFEPSKDFAFQRVSLDTQLLIFDDVQEGFNFEKLFSIITDGMPINKKNKDEFFIPKDKTPKIVIPTNYIIKGAGSSHERRKFEIELHNYYNKDFTPYHDFKRNLFYDWDDSEWSKFDNFMIKCIQYYLKHGLVKYSSINLDEKKLMASIGHDFHAWIVDNIIVNQRMILTDVFNSFTEDYPVYRKYSQKWTSLRLKKYGDYLVGKDKIDKVLRGKINDVTPYIEFIKL